MRRHVLVGRYGPDDKEVVAVTGDETVTEIQLVASNKGLDHGLGHALADLASLSVFPSEIGLDILVVAAHVNAADTRISRSTESQDTWTREVRLVVPVSDVMPWTRATTILERMLNFLTGDRWNVAFRARPPRFSSIVKTRPPSAKAPHFDALSLFSGGMDSLIGAIDILQTGGVPLLVSHAGEGATSDAQSKLFDALTKQYDKRPFARFRLWMNFPKALIKDVGSEDTTRGRSFLFFAAGVAAGTGLSTPFSLNVPENGLIAVNVPLDPLRLGSLSTRTTHPFYMARWNDLIEILGIQGSVHNPYWDKTKGEMTLGCHNKELLKHLLPFSLSCSSPAKARWVGHGIEHCGYCLPCLIRRAAVRVGVPGDTTTYTIQDLTVRPFTTQKAEGQQIRSFQVAIERLRRKPELTSLLIHKAGPLTDQTAAQKDTLAKTYARGMAEVAALLSNVTTVSE